MYLSSDRSANGSYVPPSLRARSGRDSPPSVSRSTPATPISIVSPSGGPSPFLDDDYGERGAPAASGWTVPSALRANATSCCSGLRRQWPWRTETWSEVFNVLGSLLSFCSCLLPFWLQTFRADRALSFDSVPLSIALFDFVAMVFWLVSAFLVYHVWRRDQRASAREEWEKRTASATGLSVEQRRRMQKIEDEAAARIRAATRKHNALHGDAESSATVTPGDDVGLFDASIRFDPASVSVWFKPFDVQWWACVTNIVASAVYLCGTIYAVTVSVAAASSAARVRLNPHAQAHDTRWEETTDVNSGDALSLSPQQVQAMILHQRYISLIGDVIYLSSAVFCEFVYYSQTVKEASEENTERKKIERVLAAAAAAATISTATTGANEQRATREGSGSDIESGDDRRRGNRKAMGSHPQSASESGPHAWSESNERDRYNHDVAEAERTQTRPIAQEMVAVNGARSSPPNNLSRSTSIPFATSALVAAPASAGSQPIPSHSSVATPPTPTLKSTPKSSSSVSSAPHRQQPPPVQQAKATAKAQGKAKGNAKEKAHSPPANDALPDASEFEALFATAARAR